MYIYIYTHIYIYLYIYTYLLQICLIPYKITTIKRMSKSVSTPVQIPFPAGTVSRSIVPKVFP